MQNAVQSRGDCGGRMMLQIERTTIQIHMFGGMDLLTNRLQQRDRWLRDVHEQSIKFTIYVFPSQIIIGNMLTMVRNAQDALQSEIHN